MPDSIPDSISDSTSRRPGLISKILVPAIRLWLKTQTDHLDTLTLEIQASDRSVLSGKIPTIHLTAQAAIYQGIHLSALKLIGSNIHLNLSQILRGKPLKLLAPIPLDLNIHLTETNLNASLNAPLIQPAVTQFIQLLLQSTQDDSTQDSTTPLNLQNLACRLQDNTLTLWGDLISETNESSQLALRTQLTLTSPNQLTLVAPTWLPHANAKRGMLIPDLEGYTFDLGPDTRFTQFHICPTHITAALTLTVLP
jgi:LmeA-like phospholipid-binding